MVTMIRHLQHDGRRASFEVLTGYDIEEHAPTYQAYHTGKDGRGLWYGDTYERQRYGTAQFVYGCFEVFYSYERQRYGTAQFDAICSTSTLRRRIIAAFHLKALRRDVQHLMELDS